LNTGHLLQQFGVFTRDIGWIRSDIFLKPSTKLRSRCRISQF